MGGLPKRILCFFWEEKEEDECVRKKNLCVEKMLFMRKQLCANKVHGRKLCVTNSCSGVHRRISMKKPLDSYLK